MNRQEALVTPSVMRWARERARLTLEEAAARIGRPAEEIEAWENDEKRPSLAQARRASEAYKRSLAVFYLPEPPEEFDTLKDFRQLPGTQASDYSPELALIIRQLYSRQEWKREYSIRHGTPPVAFVGAATSSESSVGLAGSIRATLGMSIQEQFSCADARSALNVWVSKAEHLGVCVCREGKIDLDEARGIALADEYAPFIYINATDSYAGRQFTLLHELVHLWINEPGLSNLANINKAPRSPDAATEAFCNRTAALTLVPPTEFAAEWSKRTPDEHLEERIETVARNFNVSDEVIARRLLDMDVISQADYLRLRAAYRERWNEHKDQNKGGGNYYLNALSFNGHAFTRTVLSARYSGEITVREASLVLGVKANNLRQLAETAGLLRPRQGGGDQ